VNLSIFNADRLGEVLRNEFDQLLAAINKKWAVAHDPKTGVVRLGTIHATVGAAGDGEAPPATPQTWAEITYVDESGQTLTGVIPIYLKDE
jgi:hypothetical protein